MLPPPPPAAAHTNLYHLLHNPNFIHVTKISLFVAKMFSLFSPCQPFAADPWAAYPLLCFASLDFLFVGFGFTVWGRHVRFGGLGGSLMLLALHVAVVGLLVRLDRLCLARTVSGVTYSL
jgi:hypothetical protein